MSETTSRKNWFLLSALGLGLLVGGGFLALPNITKPDIAQAEDGAKEAPPVLTVRVEAARMSSVTKSLEVSGSVAAWEQLSVGAETGGLRIKEVFVDEGQRVRKGQPLLLLNTDVLVTQRDQAKARLMSAQAQVRQQQTVLQQSKALMAQGQANNQSFQSLYREGAVSQLDALARSTTMQTTRSQNEQAEVAITVAQSQVAEARASLAQIEAQLNRTRIVAPDDGWVLKKQAFIGNISDVGAPLFILARQSRLELNAQVPETDLPQMQVGQVVSIMSDADPQLRATGRVRLVGPQVDSTSRQAIVKITLAGNDRLRPGMFVRGKVKIANLNALTIPTQAVTLRDDKSLVFILKGKKVLARTIETGTRAADRIEVITGLKAGEQVVTAGGGYLKDGDVVKVTTL